MKRVESIAIKDMRIACIVRFKDRQGVFFGELYVRSFCDWEDDIDLCVDDRFVDEVDMFDKYCSWKGLILSEKAKKQFSRFISNAILDMRGKFVEY